MPRYFSSIRSSLDELLVAPKPQSRRAWACRYSAKASARRSARALVEDRVVVVVVGVELRRELVAAEAGGDGEGAEVVVAAAIERGDEVGERVERLLALAAPLLAEAVEARALVGARVVGVDDDVVAVAVGGPEAVDAAGCRAASRR